MAHKKSSRPNRAARRQAKQTPMGHIGSISPAMARQYVFSIENTKPAFKEKVWGPQWEMLLDFYKSQL